MRRRFSKAIQEQGEVELMPDYCCFKALDDGFYVALSASSTSVEYCIDNGVWKTLTGGQQTESVSAGQVIAFASTKIPTWGVLGDGDKRFRLEGNIMSLLFGHYAKGVTNLTGYRMAFAGMFTSRYNLIEISDNFLPATILEAYCYQNLFADCTNLVKVPKILPATNLAERCYLNMFRQCFNIEVAPILPATTLATACYQYMFMSDGKLQEVTMLAESFVGSTHATNWLVGVPAAGVFYKSASAQWEEYGSSAIPSGWEVRIYNE